MNPVPVAISFVVIFFLFISVSSLTNLFFRSNDAIQNQTSQQVSRISKQIFIENINSTSVSIRNIGTASISTGEIQVYVDGAPRACSRDLSEIPPGTVGTCDFGFCTTGQKIRVSSPSNSVEAYCI